MTLENIKRLIKDGKYEEALKALNKLPENGQLERQILRREIADLYHNTGWIYKDKGELNQALDYFQKSLKLYEKIGTNFQLAVSYTTNGRMYFLKGDLDQALEYFQKGMSLFKEIGNKPDLADSHTKIGNIYGLKGDLNQALKHFQNSLAIYKEIDNNHEIAILNISISSVYSMKGMVNQARKSLEQTLKYFQGKTSLLRNAIYISEILCDLIRLALGQQENSVANQWFQYLEEIETQTEHKYVNLSYRLAKALILKQSPRMHQKMQAQQILINIVAEDIINHEKTIIAMQNLCELLLDELKTYGEQEVLEEAKNIITKLYEIGQEQHSYILIVNSLILKAKFALLEGEISDANELLEKALQIAEENNLPRQLIQVQKEKQLLESQLESWKILVDGNAPLYDLIQKANVHEYIKEAQEYLFKYELSSDRDYKANETIRIQD